MNRKHTTRKGSCKATATILLATLVAVHLPACSIRRTAISVIGNALAGGGSAYASDEDPDLIREAIPFGLKTYESLLEEVPEHRGLLLSAASGFTAYAYLLQDEADRLEAVDLARARVLRCRASRLYLRGRDYAIRGLEVSHPRFREALAHDRNTALAMTSPDDVPFLYWAGASWAGALTVAKDNLDLIAELPTAGALVGRILELDETFEQGAAHEFFVSYEGSRPGGSAARAREHYRQALAISRGQRASVHLALAETVTVQEQKIGEFRSLLSAALALDPEQPRHLRLINTIARRRAQWLQARIPDLFVEENKKEDTP